MLGTAASKNNWGDVGGPSASARIPRRDSDVGVGLSASATWSCVRAARWRHAPHCTRGRRFVGARLLKVHGG